MARRPASQPEKLQTAEEQEANDPATFVFVKSNMGTRVALFERNEAHPDGQAFVHGDKAHKVAETEAVFSALSDRRISYANKDGKAVKTSQEAAAGEADAPLQSPSTTMANAGALRNTDGTAKSADDVTPDDAATK
jgi:hypothetical protein